MAKTTRGLKEWPEDLELTDEMKAFAYLRGVNPTEEFEDWKDNCKAHGRKYIDWVAAWRTRVRNAVKFNPVPRPDNDGGLARVTYGKPSHLVDDSSSGVPDPELTLEQRRENIKRFKEMVANIGKKVG